MSHSELEQLAKDRRSDATLHRLDGTLLATYFASNIIGMWHQLGVCPAMQAHGPPMPLTRLVMQDIARGMRHLCAADKVDGFTAGRICFPEAWEPSGGGGGLYVI